MNDNMELLLKKIEELREALEKCIDKKGVNNWNVIEISKRLDITLNEYYKILKRSAD